MNGPSLVVDEVGADGHLEQGVVVAVDHDISHRCGDACAHAIFTTMSDVASSPSSHVSWQRRTGVVLATKLVVARHHVGASVDDGWNGDRINHVNGAVDENNVLPVTVAER